MRRPTHSRTRQRLCHQPATLLDASWRGLRCAGRASRALGRRVNTASKRHRPHQPLSVQQAKHSAHTCKARQSLTHTGLHNMPRMRKCGLQLMEPRCRWESCNQLDGQCRPPRRLPGRSGCRRHTAPEPHSPLSLERRRNHANTYLYRQGLARRTWRSDENAPAGNTAAAVKRQQLSPAAGTRPG